MKASPECSTTKEHDPKGVKVEVNEEQVTVEINVIIKYGYKLHEVCANIQSGTKNAIETMTGLTVSAVNVFVSSISFEKAKKQPAQPLPKPNCPQRNKRTKAKENLTPPRIRRRKLGA